MFSLNIEKKTVKNTNYRKVVYTDKFQQLALMCLLPGEDIPLEKHNGTQFFRVESGNGLATVGKSKKKLKDGISFIIPKNTHHYVVNTSKSNPLKLYTIYSPPQHPDKTLLRRQK